MHKTINLYSVSPSFFADVYGAGNYNSSTYSCSGTTNCGTGTSSGGSGLVNTGVAVGSVVTIACLVLLVAVVVRFWRRPAAKPVAQEQESDLEVIDQAGVERAQEQEAGDKRAE